MIKIFKNAPMEEQLESLDDQFNKFYGELAGIILNESDITIEQLAINRNELVAMIDMLYFAGADSIERRKRSV